MSGYTSSAIVHQGVLGGEMEFIAKPFAPDALLQRAREVLAK